MIYVEEHHALRKSIRSFIDREINPHVSEWDNAEEFPRYIFKKAADLGFLGITKPVALGGAGLDYSYNSVWAEELGHIHAGGIAAALGVQTDMATPALALHGSDELHKEFLMPTIAGESIACVGVSEVGAGSDVANIKTTARKDGDDYVINGGKMWTTNGIRADWMCLLANTGEEGAPHKNKSLIVVPMDTKGVDRSNRIKKHGNWAADMAQVFFDEVRVPQRFRIGEEGRGFIYQMQQFTEERLFITSRSIVQCQELLDDTAEYLRERVAFGKPLLDNQWINFTLSDLATEIACLRALTHECIEGYVRGENVRLRTAQAKLKAGKLVRTVPDECMQFMGGAGYLWDARAARMMRDCRITSIGGGANEVMMQIIARELGFQ